MRENLLQSGDYVPDGFGGFVSLQGSQALLQRALFRLSCKKGSFPFLPELGSELHSLCREKPENRQRLLKIYCQQALEGLDVFVEDAQWISRSEDQAGVRVRLRAENETGVAEVRI